MRFLILALALAALGASGCGEQQASAPQSFENARAGSASLITGSVRDWRAATDEERGLYSMASADALLAQTGASATPELRMQLTGAFQACMDTIVSQSAPSVLLSDVSYRCRDMALSGLR